MKRKSSLSRHVEPSLPLETFLPYQINVLARRMSEELAALYGAQFGITLAEWRVLAHLADAAHVSIRDIHAKVAMDKVKVTRAAQRLERAGLVQKAIQPGDRRLVALSLTGSGREMFARIVPLARAYEERAAASLSQEELAAFRSIVSRLLDADRAG